MVLELKVSTPTCALHFKANCITYYKWIRRIHRHVLVENAFCEIPFWLARISPIHPESERDKSMWRILYYYTHGKKDSITHLGFSGMEIQGNSPRSLLSLDILCLLQILLSLVDDTFLAFIPLIKFYSLFFVMCGKKQTLTSFSGFKYYITVCQVSIFSTNYSPGMF